MKRPNILLVMTDQHRLSAVGCYGPTQCRTPQLDKLAEEGVRFETAYTTLTVCSPARASVLTGLYPHAHGITANLHEVGCSAGELEASPRHLSNMLSEAGYRCGYTGKWHLGRGCSHTPFNKKNSQFMPEDCGFVGHNLPGHGGGGFTYPEYRKYLGDNGFKHEIDDDGVLTGPVESTVPYFLAENTISLIDQFSEDDDSFFIWHNNWGPHGPYLVTREYFEQYADLNIPPWPSFDHEPPTNGPQQMKLQKGHNWSHWENQLRKYYAFSTMIDDQLARIVDHLKAKNLYEDTIIIFTADHGETLGCHGGLVDKGWHHYEDTQRIPFIMHIPEKYRAEGMTPGTVMEEFISLNDVYPTVLDYAGVEFERNSVHGLSIKKLFEDDKAEWREAALVEFFGLGGVPGCLLTVRKGNIKYGWNSSAKDELYNLENDPHELTNQIDNPQYAECLEEMRNSMADLLADSGAFLVKRFRQVNNLKGPSKPINLGYCIMSDDEHKDHYASRYREFGGDQP